MLRFWPLWIPAILSVVIWTAWLWGLRINLTPSMPVGVYQISNVLPSKGDLAIFCLPSYWASIASEREYLKSGTCPTGLQPLLKRVVAVEGDKIVVFAGGIAINEQSYPNTSIRSADSSGRFIPSLLKSGQVPAGYAVLLGDSPSSFDSRYFGPVPQRDLRRVTVIQYF